jgi:hypothetical protein
MRASVTLALPWVALAFASFVACSSSSSAGDTPDTGAADSSASDAPVDTGAVDSTASDAPKLDVGSDVAADAGFACGPKLRCADGEICTQTYTTGGACLPCDADGGGCPSGSHCGGSCCTVDVITYNYACAAKPSSCTGALACGGACASSLCTSGGCPCEGASGSTMTCHCLAP